MTSSAVLGIGKISSECKRRENVLLKRNDLKMLSMTNVHEKLNVLFGFNEDYLVLKISMKTLKFQKM